MTLPGIDMEAAEREGLQPIKCPKPKCGRLLALQTADGMELRFNGNGGTRMPRVALTCSCGSIHEWRRSKGPKPSERPGKSSVSTVGLDKRGEV